MRSWIRGATRFGRDGSRAALAALLLAVAGCGGTTAPSEDPTPGTGSVGVTVAGLPVGVNGAITIRGGDGFVQAITATAVVGAVPEGTCTVSASPVAVAPADTLFAAIPVRTVPIVPDDTTYVTITYESPPPPVPPGTMAVFHGPLVFQGARRFDNWVPLEDYGQPPTTENVVDTYSLPYPAGYVIDNCEITGTDVTATGIDIVTSISGQFGSGSADASLTVDSATSVTITANASGVGSGSSAYVGTGSTTGVLNLGYPGNNKLYDVCIAISNPEGAELDLVFTWSYSGGVANTDYAYWHQVCVYQIDPLVCGQNPLPMELFAGHDFTGPSSDSGTLRIPLTGTFHRVGLGMRAEASGSWIMDNLGNGENGSASCTGSVTIEVERKGNGA